MSRFSNRVIASWLLTSAQLLSELPRKRLVEVTRDEHQLELDCLAEYLQVEMPDRALWVREAVAALLVAIQSLREGRHFKPTLPAGG